MNFSYEATLIIVCPLVFLAGFVDSIAGGGGLISIPAYLFAGLPIHNAYGTNKFSACIGTIVAAINYFKNGKMNIRIASFGALAALPGSYLGTLLALYLSDTALQLSLLIILPIVAIFTITHRTFGRAINVAPLSRKKTIVYSLITGLVIGAYDGFFGPGTGMFLILIFAGLMHIDLVEGSGTAKVVNLASNFASAITYIFGGKVLFAIGIPAAICAIAGNYLGSRLAIKIGASFVRPVIAIVAIALCIKIVADIFF